MKTLRFPVPGWPLRGQLPQEGERSSKLVAKSKLCLEEPPASRKAATRGSSLDKVEAIHMREALAPEVSGGARSGFCQDDGAVGLEQSIRHDHAAESTITLAHVVVVFPENARQQQCRAELRDVHEM